MSVKTLDSVQPTVLPASISHARTYSIDPGLASDQNETPYPSADQLDSFLEAENPLGCIRGVVWVMAFNIAAFVVGFTIWKCFKLIM